MKPKSVGFQGLILLLIATVLTFGLMGAAWGQGMKDGGKMGGGKMEMSPAKKMPGAKGDSMKMMTMMEEMAARVPRFPPVRGFGDGGVVFFIHSESSDPKISEVLSLMMGSPVITVPELSKVPDALLANVYVFKNGGKGMGPLGFQPDIFDHLPGSPGYRPLRRISFVTWKNPAMGHELKSAGKLMQARAKGELHIERTNVVVNMPMLMWPLGRR